MFILIVRICIFFRSYVRQCIADDYCLSYFPLGSFFVHFDATRYVFSWSCEAIFFSESLWHTPIINLCIYQFNPCRRVASSVCVQCVANTPIRFAPVLYPTRRALGNSGAAGEIVSTDQPSCPTYASLVLTGCLPSRRNRLEDIT